MKNTHFMNYGSFALKEMMTQSESGVPDKS